MKSKQLKVDFFFLFLEHCEPQTFQQSIEGYDMPEKIRKFHQVNNVIQFMYDRPYHKGTKDRENEFKVRRILS